MALITCKDCKKEFSTDAKRCPHCGAKKKARTSVFSWIVLSVAIVWGISAISGHSPSQITSTAGGESPIQQAISKVSLKYDWAKDGFGSVMIADFTITNSNAVAVKDLEVTCRHFAHSGTLIDTNHNVIYETAEPGKTIKIKHFNMGFIHSQAATSSCEITDLKLPGV